MAGNQKTLWLAIAYGIVCGLLGSGLILLVSRQPQGKAIQLAIPPSPPPVVVHVAGAVVQPGIYTLPPGSRINDAILAAGGVTDSAITTYINLAALIEDGQQVLVPQKSSTTLPDLNSNIRMGNESILVNINTASQGQLESLPEIGPVTAQRIIEYRETYGPFLAIEDIQKVEGIGIHTFEAIESLITVGNE